MKKLLILLLLTFFNYQYYSQSPLLTNYFEIFVGSDPVSGISSLIFKMSAVSNVWVYDGSESFPNYFNFELSNDYDTSSYTMSASGRSIAQISQWRGFNIHFSGSSSLFGYGKYKIEIFNQGGIPVSNANFYLDWRDFRYPAGHIPPGNTDPYNDAIGPANDIYLYYNHDSDPDQAYFSYSPSENSDF